MSWTTGYYFTREDHRAMIEQFVNTTHPEYETRWIEFKSGGLSEWKYDLIIKHTADCSFCGATSLANTLYNEMLYFRFKYERLTGDTLKFRVYYPLVKEYP